MRTLLRFGPAVLVALSFAVSLAASARAAEDYEIKLTRPPAIGQKYKLVADGALTRETIFTVNGQPAGAATTGYAIHLEGTVEVLAINTDSEEFKVACTIAKCTRISQEGESEILPAGRVLTATGGKEETTFSLDEGKLTEEATDALKLVLHMGEEDGYNDDKIYGTAERHPVGEPWPINTKAAADEARADKVQFDPDALTGSLKIEKTENVDGIECLRISGETHIKHLIAEAPANLTFESGSLRARYSGLYPVDPKIGVLGETMSVTHTARVHGTNAKKQKTVIDSKVQRASELKRTFLPK